MLGAWAALVMAGPAVDRRVKSRVPEEAAWATDRRVASRTRVAIALDPARVQAWDLSRGKPARRNRAE